MLNDSVFTNYQKNLFFCIYLNSESWPFYLTLTKSSLLKCLLHTHCAAKKPFFKPFPPRAVMQATIFSPRATLFPCKPLLPSHNVNSRRPSIISCSAQSVTADPSPPITDTNKLNKYSSRITEPKSQGGSQAILHGVGLSDDDLLKPQIGISSVWYEGNTCNMHLLKLSEAVKEGVENAGMVGFRFNTIGVSDAISMGTRGMCFSLQSRDLIADSIETVMSAQWYDGNISIPGCDKNVSFFFLIIDLCVVFISMFYVICLL